jgi:hypothetical protein
MEENRLSKILLYMNLESTRPRGRPRNKWQGEVREDGRIVGGQELQEKVCQQRGMEEVPENGTELSHFAHANGTNEWSYTGPKIPCL